MAGVRISHSPSNSFFLALFTGRYLCPGHEDVNRKPGDEGARDGSSDVAAAMVAANEDTRSRLWAEVHRKTRTIMLPGLLLRPAETESEGRKFYQLEFVLFDGLVFKNKTLFKTTC